VRGDPGAQHAQLLHERRRLADLKSHPSVGSRIANLSKLDVALVIEADGNMNMHAELGSARRRWPPSTPPGARTSPWAAP